MAAHRRRHPGAVLVRISQISVTGPSPRSIPAAAASAATALSRCRAGPVLVCLREILLSPRRSHATAAAPTRVPAAALPRCRRRGQKRGLWTAGAVRVCLSDLPVRRRLAAASAARVTAAALPMCRRRPEWYPPAVRRRNLPVCRRRGASSVPYARVPPVMRRLLRCVRAEAGCHFPPRSDSCCCCARAAAALSRGWHPLAQFYSYFAQFYDNNPPPRPHEFVCGVRRPGRRVGPLRVVCCGCTYRRRSGVAGVHRRSPRDSCARTALPAERDPAPRVCARAI